MNIQEQISKEKGEFGMQLLSATERKERLETLWLTAEALCDVMLRDRSLKHYAPLLNRLHEDLKNSFTSVAQHDG